MLGHGHGQQKNRRSGRAITTCVLAGLGVRVACPSVFYDASCDLSLSLSRARARWVRYFTRDSVEPQRRGFHDCHIHAVRDAGRDGPHRHDSHGPTYKIAHLRCCLSNRQIGHNCGVLIPVSAISGMPHLLPLDELLRLREPQKWILRPIWGLGGHI